MTEPGAVARYDGWADWYDEYLTGALYDEVPGHLTRLARKGGGLCLDAGCGTGVHLGALSSLGWSAVGIDISADQLRIARTRSPRVVQADVGALPFPSNVFACCVSILTLTDFDDVAPFFAEVARVLEPQARFVIVATHPCFVGPFVRMEGGAMGIATIHPGYGDTRRVFKGPGIGQGIRSKVGVRHVPLAEMLNKLIGAGLRLVRVEELGGGTVPWFLTLVASKDVT